MADAVPGTLKVKEFTLLHSAQLKNRRSIWLLPSVNQGQQQTGRSQKSRCQNRAITYSSGVLKKMPILCSFNSYIITNNHL